MCYTITSLLISVLIASSTTATILPVLHQGKVYMDANPSFVKTVTMADAAFWALRGQPDLRFRYFKTHDEDKLEALQEAFSMIEDACDLGSKNIVFRCDPPGGQCDWADAYVPRYPTDKSNNQIYLCPKFFDKRRYHDGDRARVLVHELSHVPYIRHTEDYGTYGLLASLNLPGEYNRFHADTFSWFALAAFNQDF
ncbi:hypothetical protein PpBr36_02604 [Pyricularia pennisetigena]|uniref:hypothetical protein n=1 Tax=Pyricularia pennisetigena TaxID=1578925 RepID=UPI001151F65E|nr:hypothetical protein PpBr36_02604 [Pyricularia pennisetigena]TLS31069.1 hypothetical protein PpBr36_02604 [Pyricularia pennisetigena]